MDRKWLFKKTDVDQLSTHYKTLSPTTLKILKGRGLDTPEKIDSFLEQGLNDLLDPRLMKDAVKAVDIMIESIKKNEHVIILGDYDSDGACAVSVGIRGLRGVGANVDFYTNNRFKHGYGLNRKVIDDFFQDYPDCKLIVTVDNGITSHDAVEYAHSLGIKVVITDHHETKDTLPNAEAVVDPKRKDDSYPEVLCGTGVIFKLMLLLYWTLEKSLSPLYEMLDIVALATVGDVVPLIGENRIIVKEGLRKITNEDSVVFKAFREITQVSTINAHFTLAFVYVPMINALGRLDGDPREVIQMFIDQDYEKSLETISMLKSKNEKRKEIEEEQIAIAEELLEMKGLNKVIVLSDLQFHDGIVGLIAGRLKEKYNRPTIILHEVDGVIKGSGRSIDNFHLKEIFDELSSLLLGYGGHAKAGGLSLKAENLDLFEAKINEIADSKLTEEDFVRKYFIDTYIDSQEVTFQLVEELKRLEPFGEGFRKPLLALNKFKSKQSFFMGKESQHVKLVGQDLSMIMWRQAESYKAEGEPICITALGYPEINVFRNTANLQFVVDGDNFIAS